MQTVYFVEKVTPMSLDEYVNLPWLTTVEADTCGERPCFVVRNPELGSCIRQGVTTEAALEDREAARRDQISVMLEFGDTIPQPEFWNELKRTEPTLTLTRLDVRAFRPSLLPKATPPVTLTTA